MKVNRNWKIWWLKLRILWLSDQSNIVSIWQSLIESLESHLFTLVRQLLICMSAYKKIERVANRSGIRAMEGASEIVPTRRNGEVWNLRLLHYLLASRHNSKTPNLFIALQPRSAWQIISLLDRSFFPQFLVVREIEKDIWDESKTWSDTSNQNKATAANEVGGADFEDLDFNGSDNTERNE